MGENYLADTKNIQPAYVKLKDWEYENIFRFGGGVLVSDNNFSEVAGCPSVDTGLIFFAVAT